MPVKMERSTMVLILLCKSLQKSNERGKNKKEEALYPNKRPRMYFFGKADIYKERIRSLFYGNRNLKERIMEVLFEQHLKKWVYGAQAEHWYRKEASG
jgi:hypothetical protein